MLSQVYKLCLLIFPNFGDGIVSGISVFLIVYFCSLNDLLVFSYSVSGLHPYTVLYKILSKSISLTNYKIHFFKYFNYFCQLLWTSDPKYKILLTKVIEIQNTFRSHCESISQSINEYSFNKQEKHKHISRISVGVVPVKCTVNKKKH